MKEGWPEDDICPICGKELQTYYGGERGEGPLIWRCPNFDCDWTSEKFLNG